LEFRKIHESAKLPASDEEACQGARERAPTVLGTLVV